MGWFRRSLSSVLAIFVLPATIVCAEDAGPAARSIELPAGLPKYDLQIRLDTDRRVAHVRQVATVVNTSNQPVSNVVFNAHAQFVVAPKDIGMFAKTLEYLRVAPSEGLPTESEPPMRVQGATLRNLPALGKNHAPASAPLCSYRCEATSLEVELPRPLAPGESVEVELTLEFRIAPKKGRWGQWAGMTMLAQWLPTVAVLDVKGWHPTPFIPWHQPFCNEAGIYSGTIVLPENQKLACPCPIRSSRSLGNGWAEQTLEPTVLRDFSLAASSRYDVSEGRAGRVAVRCLHLPEHAASARMMVETVCQALPIYEQWFGPYPYAEYTIAETAFGWNGNECAAMVMVDERMFHMPHLARSYPIYLLQHELCHQWWYNIVGTDGYAETWMDEGFATYLSHRLADRLVGRNNKLLDWPSGFGWMPTIHREDLRFVGMVGARRRGDAFPTVQEMDKFGHLPNLLATTYDRGGKIVGMIEERMGEAAFLDFLRRIVAKYRFRILRVHDLQAELEAYTGRSWDDFFRYWVRGSGMCDWAVEDVKVQGGTHPLVRRKKRGSNEPVEVEVLLRQKGGIDEPTVLGIRMGGSDQWAMRIPIRPEFPVLDIEELGAKAESFRDASGTAVRVRVTLPSEPTQITVDPDNVLLDEDPLNNRWKKEIRWRLTPLYTQLDEVDVVNPHDRWTVIAGPWFAGATYADPWYTRSTLSGARVGLFRTQQFAGGAYFAYRSNDRNMVAGVDAVFDHLPLPRMQLGFAAERALDSISEGNVPATSRGVIYARYVLMYGSSLYLPPFEHIETFFDAQQYPLPQPYGPIPGTDPFNNRAGVGIHYHKYMLTPYWDAEGGAALDVSYKYGMPIFGDQRTFQQVYGQASTVKSMPVPAAWQGMLADYLRETRWAFRLGGGAALPNDGLFFSLGGAEYFRGYDPRARFGSSYWVGSVEWRLPLMKQLEWDHFDHIAGIRNIYVVPFFDIGNTYQNSQAQALAEAVGIGIRVDVAWFGMIERTMLRFDVAQALDGSPVQFWFGVGHPF